MDAKIVGNFILNLRKDEGWSQAQLAERLFVSESTVCKWERGRGYPDLAQFPILAEVFSVSVDELMQGNRFGKSSAEQRSAPSELTLKQKKQIAKEINLLTFKRVSRVIVFLLVAALLVGSFMVGKTNPFENVFAENGAELKLSLDGSLYGYEGFWSEFCLPKFFVGDKIIPSCALYAKQGAAKKYTLKFKGESLIKYRLYCNGDDVSPKYSEAENSCVFGENKILSEALPFSANKAGVYRLCPYADFTYNGKQYNLKHEGISFVVSERAGGGENAVLSLKNESYAIEKGKICVRGTLENLTTSDLEIETSAISPIGFVLFGESRTYIRLTHREGDSLSTVLNKKEGLTNERIFNDYGYLIFNDANTPLFQKDESVIVRLYSSVRVGGATYVVYSDDVKVKNN